MDWSKNAACSSIIPMCSMYDISTYIWVMSFGQTLVNSIDWFKGKIAGKSHISWENLWFPVKIFPSTNPLSPAISLTWLWLSHGPDISIAVPSRKIMGHSADDPVDPG